MTIGSTAYQSIVNEQPWLRDIVPDSIIRSIDTSGSMLQFGVEAELGAVTSATKVLIAHSAGVLTDVDYATYANFRHAVYDTQVAWVRSTRDALYRLPGGYVVANRIPWPTWLPVIQRSTPRGTTQIPTSTQGLGAGPAAVPTFVLVIGIIAALAAVAYIANVASVHFAGAFQASVHSYAGGRALESIINARMQAVQACIAQGGDATSCRQQADAAVPVELARLVANFAEPPSKKKDVLWYVGFATLVLVVGGVGYYGYKAGWFDSGRARALSGVSRRKRRSGALGDPSRLSTLDDKRTPSKYMLEV